MTIAHYCMYTWVSSFKGVVIVSETPHKLLSCELWLLTGCCDRCSTGGECLLKTQAVTRTLEQQSRSWERERPWVGPRSIGQSYDFWMNRGQCSAADRSRDPAAEASGGRCHLLWRLVAPVWPSQPLSSVITVVCSPLSAPASPGQYWGQWAVRTLQ